MPTATAGRCRKRRFNWSTLIANKDKEIARLEGAYTATLERARVAIVKTRAVIVDAHTVQLANGKRVRAAYILIATGGAPSYGDPIPGIEHAISSNEAFHLPELPAHVVIQGGGYIALEFAGIFAGLGSHVTVIYRGENILRGFDDEVRQHVRTDMEKRGIRVFTGCKVAAIERTGTRLHARLSSGTQLPADCVMFATGRTPHVAKLGLSEVGVALAKNGGIAVDEYSRTSVANIYAIGDVTNRINLTPVAIREGHAFADTVFGGKPTRGRPHQRADRGLLRAGSRSGRPDRSGGAGTVAADGYLSRHVQAAEGDLVRPRHDRSAQARGRRPDRSRGWLSYCR